MGAYDNPTLIQDMHGAKAWADAATMLSGGIATGMNTLAEAIKKQRKEADDAANLWNLAFNEASLNENRKFNEVMTTYSTEESDKNLIEEVMQIGVGLLEGTDGEMGAIEARTLLATKNDLSKDERKRYQNIINISDRYQMNIKRAAGVVAGDVEVITNVNQETIKDHYWQGNTMEEKMASMFAGNRLAGFGFEGVSFETDVRREEGARGYFSNILQVKTKIKRNHKLIKNIAAFQDENEYKADEDGYITINWERDLNKWDGGLLEELTATTDYDKINKQTNITKKNGELSPGLEVNLGIAFENLSDGKMRSVEKIWLNRGKMENAFLNSVDLDGRIAELMTLGPSHLQAYIEQRLKMGAEFKIDEFLKLSPKQQEAQLRTMELERYKEEMGINLGSDNIEGFGLETQKLTADSIAKLQAQGIDTTNMVEWDKGMTEENNPNAYGYFYVKRSNPMTNPSYVKPGSKDALNKSSWSNWNKVAPKEGWGANAIFNGEILAGENKLSRRIIWDDTTKMWKPQIWVGTVGTYMGEMTSSTGGTQNLTGLQPSANKAVFQNWLFPSRTN